MSSTVLGNYTTEFIVYMERLYDKYKRDLSTQATPEDFAKSMGKYIDDKKKNTTTADSKAKTFFDAEWKQITVNVSQLCKGYRKLVKESDALYKDLDNKVKPIDIGTNVLIGASIMVVIIYTYFRYVRSGDLSWPDTIKLLCIVGVICVVLIVIGVLIIDSNNKKGESQTKIKKQNDALFGAFKRYFNGDTVVEITGDKSEKTAVSRIDIPKISDFDNDLKEIVKSVATPKKPTEEDLDKYFKSFAGPFALNVYSMGNGRANIERLEQYQNNYNTYKSITNILSKHYDLMLMSSNPSQEDRDVAAEGVLDNIVVKELASLDLKGLEDKTTYTTEYITKMLRDSEDFTLFQSSIKHTAVYMYLFFSVVDYKDVQELEKKGFFSKPENVDTSTLSESQQEAVKRFNSAKELYYVQGLYPITAERYYEEMKRIKDYLKVPAYAVDVPKIEEFIKFSSNTMFSIYTDKNSQYFDQYYDIVKEEEKMKANTPNSYEEKKVEFGRRKREVFDAYLSEFNAYFQTMYDNLIMRRLASLNPLPTQYIIFDDKFMGQVIDDVFVGGEMQNFQSSFIKSFKDSFKEKIVKVQQASFKEKYLSNSKGSSSDSTGTTLAEDVINKKVQGVISRIAPRIAPFNISVSKYSTYIKERIRTVNRQTTPLSAVTSAKYDEIFLKVDFEVELIKKVLKDKDTETSRFVPLHTFVNRIDEMDFATLVALLQSKNLDNMTERITPELWAEDTEDVGKKEKKLWKYYAFFIVIAFLAYVYYSVYVLTTTTGANQVKLSPATVWNIPNEQKETLVNLLIKLVLPVCGIILVASVAASRITKDVAITELNKDMMTKNTNEIKRNAKELKTWVETMTAAIPLERRSNKIVEIKELTYDRKYEIYQNLYGILTNFDKCNYIASAHKATLPFPYTEVLVDGAFIAIILGAIGFVFYKFTPITRVEDLKELYEYKSMAETMYNEVAFAQEILVRYGCFKEGIKQTRYAMKSLGVLGLLGFVIFYSVKINESSKDFKTGVRNVNAFALTKSKGRGKKGDFTGCYK